MRSVRHVTLPWVGLLVLLVGLLAPEEVARAGSGTWMPTGSMSVARFSHTATLLPDGKVLVAGGAAGTCCLASAELFVPRHD
jgi:hypothetical protein